MKNKVAVFGFVLVLIIVGISGCTQENTPNKLGYSNDANGFGINPPSGWTIDEDNASSQGNAVMFLGPVENNFSANLGITNSYPLGSDTIGSIADAVLASYPSVLTNFTLISNTSRTVNGMGAYEIVYTFTQENITIEGKQIIVEKNNKVFFITYSALPETYDTYNSVVEESINSFTVT